MVEPTFNPLYLWGKYKNDLINSWHPLLYHMLDAGAVTLILWERCLAKDFKDGISKYFGLSSTETGSVLAFWTSLHDIGKAEPEFQQKNQDRKSFLVECGFPFPSPSFQQKKFHGTATTCILRKLFRDTQWQIPKKFRMCLASTLGGHHGIFPNNAEINDCNNLSTGTEYEAWQEIQENIFTLLEKTINPVHPLYYPQQNADINSFLLVFAGLCSTADWIASNEEYFNYDPETHSIADYYEASKVRATMALNQLGWIGWQPRGEVITFKEMFPGYSPNQVQINVIQLAKDIQSPYLVILEAQTGSGKTEAALYLSDISLQTDEKKGIYFALPTQATSNQMFQRVSKFLARRYPDRDINLHLVHGKALYNPKASAFSISNIWSEIGEKEGNLHSYSWFLPRKRTLLAPFGVGTVDQTFISVLRSRHFFVRLFGLSHKVLVFDEVHAYDVYMTEVFKNLLHWLRSIGTSVIILSATLTKSERKELLDAYTGKDNQLDDIPYPRITASFNNQIKEMQAGSATSRTIGISWVERNPKQIVDCVKMRISDGGCAAIICNTVHKAQDLFQAFNAEYQGEAIDIILFHGRFPYQWRKEIEDKILRLFSKEQQYRPKKAILIATQVIEQSLDLDFDLMISDLAPIDLLIQRIGRLHRHTPMVERPLKLNKPEFIISSFSSLDQIVATYEDSFIYSPYILGKTYVALNGKNKLVLPDETDELIESVYSELADEKPVLQKARADMLKGIENSKRNAQNYLIPHSNKDFIGSLKNFFGDDPGSLSQRYIQAPTREMDASLQIVCFEKRGEEIFTFDRDNPIDLNKKLSEEEVMDCLKAEITLSSPGIIRDILNQPHNSSPGFHSTAALRWHIPIFFTNNIAETEHYLLTLNKDIGLKIEKKK